MTISAYADEIGSRLPSDSERAVANQLREVIASRAAGDAILRILDDDRPPTEVTLTPVTPMLSTQQAADILNVSRPYIISVLDKGDIPHTTVGRHRRIKAEDLFAYKRAGGGRRGDALSALAESDADLL